MVCLSDCIASNKINDCYAEELWRDGETRTTPKIKSTSIYCTLQSECARMFREVVICSNLYPFLLPGSLV